MTRDEAFNAVKKSQLSCPASDEWCNRTIDLFIALGMLNLDESKTEGVEDEKLETQFKHDGFLRRTEIAYVFNVLDELNLKIAEK